MICREDLIRKSVYLTYNSYLEKFSDAKPLAETLDPILTKMDTMEEDDPLYEDHLKIFDEFLSLENNRIKNYIIGILFERPLLPYRIEAITNNAAILADELYKNHTIEDLVPRLFEEIFSSLENKGKLDALLYCLSQLSINISNENVMSFIGDCLDQMKRYRDKNSEKLLIVLNILKFFFQNSLADFARFVPDFLYNFIPFLFNEKPETAATVNTLLKSLLKTQEKEQCCLFLNEFYSKLSSALVTKKDQTFIYAMNQEAGLDPYINILINSLVYGWQADCETALKFYQMILSTVKVEFLSNHVLKLTGPLIRVANYNYELLFKKKIIEVLNRMHQMKLPLKPFESQLQLTYIRLIKEASNDKETLSLLVFNVLDLLEQSSRKDYFMNELFIRFKESIYEDIAGRNGFLYVLKKALKRHKELFSKALLENLFSQLKSIETPETGSLETVYYMGKCIGLLSNYSKKALVLEVINKEAALLQEEKKEDLEGNLIGTGREKFRGLCYILGVFSNEKILEEKGEFIDLVAKIGDNVIMGVSELKGEESELCIRFLKRINKSKGKIKELMIKESLSKDFKEKLN